MIFIFFYFSIFAIEIKLLSFLASAERNIDWTKDVDKIAARVRLRNWCIHLFFLFAVDWLDYVIGVGKWVSRW